MSRRLAGWVYVHHPETGETFGFGPDDDLPGWAADLITNPSAWEPGSRWFIPASPDPVERPKGNASRDAWAAYADALGVTYPKDATRNEIRDLIEVG